MYAYRVLVNTVIVPSLVGRRLGPRVINVISNQRPRSFACVARATLPCVPNAYRMGISASVVQDHRRFHSDRYRNKGSSRIRI